MSGDTDDLLRFKHIVATIALEHPAMTMQEGIRLALRLEEELADRAQDLLTTTPAMTASVKDPYSVAAYLYDNKYALAARPFWIFMNGYDPTLPHGGGYKKINAIKEARALTSAGLKEAKEAVELLERFWPHRPKRTTPPF